MAQLDEPISTSAETAFVAAGVGLILDGKTILEDIDLSFPKGEVVGLIGHNGSGKSSLMRIMARQCKPSAGTLHVFDRNISAYGERDFARRIGYLPQDTGAGAEMTVGELIACGRYPWHGALGRFTETDQAKVEAALRATHLDGMADHFVSTLSGGERQRAWLAMLIAQDTDCLLLDEPTAALDIAHQIEVLSLIRGLCREKELSVVIVMHDINMAIRFCDRIHALKGGKVVASGAASDVMQEASLKAIYGVDMGVLRQTDLSWPLAYVR